MMPNYIIFGCLTSIICFSSPTLVAAEEAARGADRIILGGQLGIDFTTSAGSDENDTGASLGYRAGFTGACTLGVRLTGSLSAQTEIGLTVKGDRFETDSPSTSSTYYIAYLELPLLLRASVPISNRFEPYGYAGPALGILLDADIKYDDGRFYERNSRIEPLDIGLMFGAGAAVGLGAMGALTLDLRYNLGLRNTIRNPVGDSEAFNRAIYLTVGYRADLATIGRLFGRGSP